MFERNLKETRKPDMGVSERSTQRAQQMQSPGVKAGLVWPRNSHGANVAGGGGGKR